MSNRTHTNADVLQCTLDLMVLRTLNSLGPPHGYATAARGMAGISYTLLYGDA